MQGEAGRTAGPARGRDQVMIEKRLSASNPPATTSAAPSETSSRTRQWAGRHGCPRPEGRRSTRSSRGGCAGAQARPRPRRRGSEADRPAAGATPRGRATGPGPPRARWPAAARRADGTSRTDSASPVGAPAAAARSQNSWTASSSSSADISYTVSPVTRRTARLVTSTRTARRLDEPGQRRGGGEDVLEVVDHEERGSVAPPPRAPPACRARSRPARPPRRPRRAVGPRAGELRERGIARRMATSRAAGTSRPAEARRPSPAWPSRGARSASGSPPPADEARGERHRGRVARTAPSVNQLLAGARRCRDRRCCVEW